MCKCQRRKRSVVHTIQGRAFQGIMLISHHLWLFNMFGLLEIGDLTNVML